jgi:hypothetical protein
MKYWKIFLICIFAITMILSNVAYADIEDIDISASYYGPLWDINHNGVTNGQDLSILVNNYFTYGENGWIRSDINDNGAVNGQDLSILVNHYFEDWIT